MLSAESDYTITKNQDSTETYTFNNDVFSKLTNDTNYRIQFTFNDGSVSSYKLYVGSELERADKTALVNAIADASRHIEIDYTPESWTVLQNALNSALRAQLRITYDDGTTEIIPTDTSWKCTYGGPVMYGDIFHGEYYNANYDTAWMENGYDDSSWASAKAYDYNVKLAAQRGQRLRIREELELPALSAAVYEGAVGADNNQYGVINTKAIYSGKR